MHRNHANRADTAGARDEHPAGGGRQRVGGREGHVIGHGPDRLDLTRRTDAVGQIEHATRLATRRIDVEQDGRHFRIADGGIQLRGEARVTGQPRLGLQPHGAAHQRAVDGDDSHTGRRSGYCACRRRVAGGGTQVGKANPRAEHGQDHVKFWAMDRQRHAEEARRQMR